MWDPLNKSREAKSHFDLGTSWHRCFCIQCRLLGYGLPCMSCLLESGNVCAYMRVNWIKYAGHLSVHYEEFSCLHISGIHFLFITAGCLITAREYVMAWILFLLFSWLLSTCFAFWKYLTSLPSVAPPLCSRSHSISLQPFSYTYPVRRTSRYPCFRSWCGVGRCLAYSWPVGLGVWALAGSALVLLCLCYPPELS